MLNFGVSGSDTYRLEGTFSGKLAYFITSLCQIHLHMRIIYFASMGDLQEWYTKLTHAWFIFQFLLFVGNLS